MGIVCSIVIPAHNAAAYIDKALDSVLAQTFKEWECIVVDDFSEDATADIAAAYAAKDARIRLIRNETNLKVALTRNRGASEAVGKYIAFLDSDDIFLPHKLERQLAVAETTGCPFICSSYSLIDENGASLDKISLCAGHIDLKRLIKSNEIGCSTVLLDRELALRHPFTDEFYHEDYACWLGVIKECGHAQGIYEPLVLYRFTEGSKSGNKLNSAKQVFDIYRRYLGLPLPSACAKMLGYFKRKLRKYAGSTKCSENIPVIFDNIVFSLQRVGGISAYWRRMIDSAAQVPDISESYVERPEAMQNISRALVKADIPYPKDDALPLCLRRFNDVSGRLRETTVFHSSYYRTMYAKNALNVVTVYDFTYQWYYTGLVRFIHIAQQKHSAKKADAIICISENTRRDLMKLVPSAAEKYVAVIPLGYDESVFYFDPACKREAQVVFVGSRAKYKNFAAAVSAVAACPGISLAVVGSPLTEDEQQLLNSRLPRRHFSIMLPSDKDLRHIYNSSYALLYISEYEGFGLPIIEAMASGCPVIALNTGAQPEAAGDAGLLFDSPDSAGISDAVRRLTSDSAYFEDTVQKGLSHASRFPWSKCTDRTLALYRELTGKF